MSARDRRSHPTSQARLLAQERQQKALVLARRGLTTVDIARELGYKQASGAYRALMRAIQRADAIMVREATKLRHLQFAGLQDLKRRLFAQLGGVVLLDKEGRPIMDQKTERPKFRPLTAGELADIVRAVLKVFEREARLMGLDLQTVSGALPPEEGEGGLPTSLADGEVLTIEVAGEVMSELGTLTADSP